MPVSSLNRCRKREAAETRFGRTGIRRHRLAREAADAGNRAHHARVEHASRQRLAKTHLIEFGGGDVVVTALAQQRIGRKDFSGVDGPVGPHQPLGQILDHAIRHALRLERHTDCSAVVAGDGMALVRQSDEQLGGREDRRW